MKKMPGKRGAFVALVMTMLATLAMLAACALDGANLIGPGGGFVFYDKGSYSGGWRYLECAPENAGTGTWEDARKLCEDYSLGGYGGWRLPDKDELEELLNGKHGTGLFSNGVYWSSQEEEGSAGYAWGIQNGDSPEPSDSSYSSGNVQDPDTYSKDNEYWARPVREF
ncbi:MAG: DUF1566 domain-containing protein [Spirochaetaceae bacterium]|nr:DUF1566 domain-containing protein [Spirochaetaceae bacterium]